MRPPKVSEEKIIKAGLALVADGKQVTASALRTSLVAGNAKRLIRVWETYQAEQTAGQAAPPLVLPPGVARRLDEITRRLRVDLLGVAQDLQRDLVDVLDPSGQHVAESSAAELTALRQQVAELKASLDKALDHIGRLFIHLNDLPSNDWPEPMQKDFRRARAFLKALALPELPARAQLVNATLKRGRGLVSPPPAELS